SGSCTCASTCTCTCTGTCSSSCSCSSASSGSCPRSGSGSDWCRALHCQLLRMPWTSGHVSQAGGECRPHPDRHQQQHWRHELLVAVDSRPDLGDCHGPRRRTLTVPHSTVDPTPAAP